MDINAVSSFIWDKTGFPGRDLMAAFHFNGKDIQGNHCLRYCHYLHGQKGVYNISVHFNKDKLLTLPWWNIQCNISAMWGKMVSPRVWYCIRRSGLDLFWPTCGYIQVGLREERLWAEYRPLWPLCSCKSFSKPNVSFYPTPSDAAVILLLRHQQAPWNIHNSCKHFQQQWICWVLRTRGRVIHVTTGTTWTAIMFSGIHWTLGEYGLVSQWLDLSLVVRVTRWCTFNL